MRWRQKAGQLASKIFIRYSIFYARRGGDTQSNMYYEEERRKLQSMARQCVRSKSFLMYLFGHNHVWAITLAPA